MDYKYNSRCPAVKRLLQEAKELHEATEEYFAHPIDDNLFEWHFTVRGPPETEFEGGVYHGRIIMPSEYPMKPPNIIFFTANGRFETNKKICLSISGHHPETWQPSWSIRTALLAIIGFMPTPAKGTIGGLDYTTPERVLLAKRSVEYMCSNCGRVGDLLKERTGDNAEIQKEAREVSAQMVVTGKKEDFIEDKSLLSSENKLENATAESRVASPSDSSLETQGASPAPTEEKPSQSPASPSSPQPLSRDPPQSPYAEMYRPPQYEPQVGRDTRSSSSGPSSMALMANNILLSAAVTLLIALVLRRLFLLESEATDEMDDVLL